MHYLKTYPESIGISHYLCWRMRSMPADEVEFYWPQIWYVYSSLLLSQFPTSLPVSWVLSGAPSAGG